jgi:hypothetical protein
MEAVKSCLRCGLEADGRLSGVGGVMDDAKGGCLPAVVE